MSMICLGNSGFAWFCILALAATGLGAVAHAQSFPAELSPPFQWVSTPPLISAPSDATHPLVSIKDPTVVYHDGRWHVFATTATDRGHWGMVYLSFADWKDAASAKPFYLDDNPNLGGYHCAPQVFYFAPQKLWYLIYQSQQPTFSTTADLSKPETWTKPTDFFVGTPKSVVDGWIDYWIICDDTHAYLFFSDDHGRFYRSRTTIGEFPKGFDDPVVVMFEKEPRELFEASCVYRIKGTGQYLALIECANPSWQRYFKAFIADRLDGQWRPLAAEWGNSFADITRVRFEDANAWTRDISHGEILRDGVDQTLTIDPANLVLLYQGLIPEKARGLDYGKLPWQLALLRRE